MAKSLADKIKEESEALTVKEVKATKTAKTTSVIKPDSKSVVQKRILNSKAINANVAKFLAAKTGQKALGFSSSPLPCVPTGSAALDNLIGGNLAPDKSGPICPGYPKRHITEIYGPEGSGKTTLALEAIVEVQKAGGTAMFLDFEHALMHSYAQGIGVNFDPSQFLLYQPNSLEEGFNMIRVGLRYGIDLIVVDSVAAMVPQAEMEKTYDEAAKVGAQASKLSNILPRLVNELKTKGDKSNPEGTALILLNQERSIIKQGPGYGPTEQSSGGKALKFYAYLRLAVKRVGSITKDVKDPMTKKSKKIPYGNKTTVKVVKSKVDAKQGAWADIFIRYGKGIDEAHTIIESGVAHNVIKRAGARYTYGEYTAAGMEKFRNLLVANPTVFEDIRNSVIDVLNKQNVDNSLPDEDYDDSDDFAGGNDLDDIFESDGSSDDIISGEDTEIVLGDDD